MNPSTPLSTRRTLTLAGGLLLAVAGGCIASRQPNFAPTFLRTDDAYRAAARSETGPEAAEVAWWRSLNDPVFEDLADRALRSNLDLASARQRIVAGRALAGAVDAQRQPQVDLQAQAIRAGTDRNGLAFAAPPAGRETNLFAAGVVAGWELDLWGRVEKLVDAADSDRQAAVEGYRDLAVSLLSELALAYVDVRTLSHRISLVEQSVELQRQTLNLAESRFEAGTGTELDVSQGRRLLRRTLARIPELRRAQAVAENRIAVLLGERPQDGLIPPGDVPESPPTPALGLPANLLTRRADIRQAAWAYRAAVARTDATEREHLPRLSLNGSIRMSADDVGTLFNRAYTYSFGPQITFPLFEGGRIDANVRARTAQAEEARLTLERRLLGAIAEVENAAIGELRERERAASLEKAVEAAEKSVTLANQLYRSGLRGMPQVIDAQRELVSVQDDLAVARQQEFGETVRLYRALGGGWELLALDAPLANARRQEVGP